MFLLKFLRFLRGTVVFLITGTFPEKLLNRCSRERIALFGARPCADGFHAGAYASSYKKISSLAKKSGCRTRIEKKSGLPFFLLRFKRRKGLWFGAAAGLLLLWYLSGHIWVISVAGCQSVTEQEALKMLSQCGLLPGVSARALDPSQIEKQMLLLDPRISWITVNLNGSGAEVILSECEEQPVRVDPDDRYANVVAAQDGQICAIELYAGQALLRVGDTVRAGDVIVSGITGDQYGNSRLKYARARVLAHVYEESSVTVPFRERTTRPGETPVKKRELFVFGRRVLPSQEVEIPQNAFSPETTARGILYPFLLVKETSWYPAEETVVLRNRFEAKEEAMRRLRAGQKADPAFKILSEELHLEESKDALTVHSVAYAEKDISKTAEFSVS